MTDEDKVYFATTDPEGREIVLTKKGMEHIKQRHPEIQFRQIRPAINNPDYITEQVSHRRSLVYTKATQSQLYINVFTKMDDNEYTKGKVSTAFLMGSLPEGDVIWMKTR